LIDYKTDKQQMPSNSWTNLMTAKYQQLKQVTNFVFTLMSAWKPEWVSWEQPATSSVLQCTLQHYWLTNWLTTDTHELITYDKTFNTRKSDWRVLQALFNITS